ncbi:MAG: hypothetical protein QG579_27 [Patescibacteria group bacterium]|jgi:hypothetical protein|nr:hypothetical protein [Patescibacteria group bacterium]
MKGIIHFFDVLEDKIRAQLSKNPLLYALVGGIGVVLFWRGVWHIADEANISALASIIIGSIMLLLSGAFVSTFIGSRLIISGLKGEKKLVEKTEDEIKSEGSELKRVENELDKIEHDIRDIKNKLSERPHHHSK